MKRIIAILCLLFIASIVFAQATQTVPLEPDKFADEHYIDITGWQVIWTLNEKQDTVELICKIDTCIYSDDSFAWINGEYKWLDDIDTVYIPRLYLKWQHRYYVFMSLEDF